MAWRNVTPEDVRVTLNLRERDVCDDFAIDGGENPILEAIAAVVPRCQGWIADNAENALPDNNTELPERVILSACHMIRFELLTRLDLDVSEEREKAYDKACRFFERVADGKARVEQPIGAVQPSLPESRIETVKPKVRENTRDNLRGL